MMAVKDTKCKISQSKRFNASGSFLVGCYHCYQSHPIQQQFRLQSTVKGSEPLGYPLPSDEHACSVSLPTWSSVVGYEEGDQTVTSQLKCGYPRFVYHPYVLQLMQTVLERYSKPLHAHTNDDSPSCCHYVEDCLLLPSKAAALRCQAFLQLALHEYKHHQVTDNALILESTTTTEISDCNRTSAIASRVRVIEWKTPEATKVTSVSLSTGLSNAMDGASSTIDSKSVTKEDVMFALDEDVDDTVHAVLFPATTVAGMQAKAYWQHTGEICSSRRAERALTKLNVPISTPITSSRMAHHPAFASVPNSIVTNNNNYTSQKTSMSLSGNRTSNHSGTSTQEELRTNIASWAGIMDAGGSDFVFLTPSGMSSIYTGLRSARRYKLLSQSNSMNNGNVPQNPIRVGGGTAIVYGFPYLDTLKLCSRPELSPSGVEFFGFGCCDDLKNLSTLLENKNNYSTKHGQQYSVLFTEVPSNPLLQCPNLYELRRLADLHDFCLIIDDTISNFLNVDVLTTGIADAVCTSLTKLISGRGDAIAGSIVCNPYTVKGRWMQQDLRAHHDSSALHPSDARAILSNSRDFVERNEIINSNAIKLAEWMNSDDCPDVDKVYYPKFNDPLSVQNYDAVRRNGYGGLMSILLPRHMCQRHFYDAIDVAKGPSLGTNFTLLCPYTLLAHYHELDFAMGYNVPPNLLRLSVGMEPFELLQEKFYNAFQHSRLYPKPTYNRKSQSSQQPQQPQQQQRRSFASTTMQRSSSTNAQSYSFSFARWDASQNLSMYENSSTLIVDRRFYNLRRFKQKSCETTVLFSQDSSKKTNSLSQLSSDSSKPFRRFLSTILKR